MNVTYWMDTAVCDRLLTTLAHFLWQGVLAGAIVLVGQIALSRAAARWRHSVALLALVVMAICPVVTFLLVPGQASNTSSRPGGVAQARAAATLTRIEAVAEFSSRPAALDLPVVDQPSALPSRHAVERSVEPTEHRTLDALALARLPESWRRGAIAAYLVGLLAMTSRLLISLWSARRLRRFAVPVTQSAILQALAIEATRLGLRRVPAVAWCRRIAAPTVTGLIRPLVLLPVSLCTSLSSDQLAVILSHELAHLRRWDPWIQLVQRFVESLLFFHPAVWYVSRRLSAERELCCDELVVSLGAEPVQYADALLRVAEAAHAANDRHHALALQAAGRDGQLAQRIRRLLGQPVRESLRPGRGTWAVAAVLLAILASPFWLAWADGPEETETRKQRAPVSDEPADRIPAGDYSVTLANGVTAEVVAVARNPRRREQWWAPDGTPIPPPVDELDFLDPAPERIDPEHEVALIVRTTVPEQDGKWSVQPEFIPPSRADRSWATGYREFKPAGQAQILVYPPDVERITYRFVVAAGPWEQVATFDGKMVQIHVPEVEVDCTVPRQEGPVVRFDVTHNLDRDQYGLRMRARLKDGSIRDVAFHPGVVRGVPAQGFVDAYTISVDQVAEYIVERAPWARGEIPDITLMPDGGLSPIDSAPQSAEAREIGVRVTRTKDVIEGEGWIAPETALDLETGRLHRPDIEATMDGAQAVSAMRTWAAETQSDLLVSPDDPRPVLIGLAAVLIRADPGRWFDGLEQRRLRANTLLQHAVPGFPTVVSAPEAIPAAFMFRTREGSLGVLQIAAFSDDQESMRIRYRLRLRGANAPLQEGGEPANDGRDRRPKPQQIEPEAPRFDEVIERTVNSESVRKDSFIDLDTGRLLTPPKDPPPGPDAFRRWLEESGADAQGTVGGRRNIQGLACFDVVTIPVDRQCWSSPAQVSHFLSYAESARPGTPTFMTGKGELPETYLFKTGENRIGLLQIVGLDDEPHAVRIRYKLLETGEKAQQAPPEDRRKLEAPAVETSRRFGSVSLQPDGPVHLAPSSVARMLQIGDGSRAGSGLQLRLHADRQRWPADEDVILKLDLALPEDGGTLEQVDSPDNWLLEIDEETWLIQHVSWEFSQPFRIEPGQRRKNHAILQFHRGDEGIEIRRLTSEGKVWSELGATRIDPDTGRLHPGRRLDLPPGEHAMRIRFQFQKLAADVIAEDRIWSNPLTLMVRGDDQPPAGKRQQTVPQDEGDAVAEQRHFVRLVVGPDKLTFEGRETTWDALPRALKTAPNPSSAVLEVAISTDEISVAKERQIIARAAAEAKKAGLDHASYIGVHELGSKGSESKSIDKERKAAAPAAPSKKPKHFVRLVVGQNSLRFVPREVDRQPGQETTWEELPQLLGKVPNRADTVLEVAVESEEFSIRELNSIQGRAAALARMFGFQYSSYIGVQPIQLRVRELKDAETEEKSTPDQSRPQTNLDEDQQPAAKRQRFVPQQDMADKTSWAMFDGPSALNPDGWALMTRMTLGGVAPVKLADEQVERFRIQLSKGDDGEITLRLTYGKGAQTLALKRDVPQEVMVPGTSYRLLYPSTEVAADQPETTPFAQVIVSPVKRASPKAEEPKTGDISGGSESEQGANSATDASTSDPANEPPDFNLGIWNKPLKDYARSRRSGASFTAIDLAALDKDVWVDPEALGLPRDAPADVILDAAGRVDLCVLEPDVILPVRGTIVSPLDLPPAKAGALMQQIVFDGLKGVTKGQIAAQILAWHRRHADQKSFRLELNKHYAALCADGSLVVMGAHGAPGDIWVQFIPIGTTQITATPGAEAETSTRGPADKAVEGGEEGEAPAAKQDSAGKSDFQGDAPPKGLEFLRPYPKLHALSLDMTEERFLEIINRKRLKLLTNPGQRTYSIPMGDGHTVLVMFGSGGDKCSGIQRIRSEPTAAEPGSADNSEVTFSPVVEMNAAGQQRPVNAASDTVGDRDAIQGTWKLIAAADGGRKGSQEHVNDSAWVITGEKITFTQRGKTKAEWTYRLDPTRQPKWIDLVVDRRTVMRGIYELSENRLKVCFNDNPGEERSTAFESKPDSPNDVLLVLKRVPPDNEKAPAQRFVPQEKIVEQPAIPPWGDPVEGVSVRLTRDKSGSLRAEVRNQGSNNWLVFCDGEFGQLEVDGTRYFWGGNRQGRCLRLSPGQQFDPFPVDLDYPDFWSRWATKNGEPPHLEALRLSPGEHTVRFAPHLYPEDGSRESRRIWSQPVTIRIAAGDRPNTGAEFKQRPKTSQNAGSPAGSNTGSEAAVPALPRVGASGAKTDQGTQEVSVREQELIGRWIGGHLGVEAIHFRDDGRFEQIVYELRGTPSIDEKLTGTWKIEDGKLLRTFDDDPKVIRATLDESAPIVELNEDRLRLTSHQTFRPDEDPPHQATASFLRLRADDNLPVLGPTDDQQPLSEKAQKLIGSWERSSFLAVWRDTFFRDGTYVYSSNLMDIRYGTWKVDDGDLTLTWRSTDPEAAQPESSPQKRVIVEVSDSQLRYAKPERESGIGFDTHNWGRVKAK